MKTYQSLCIALALCAGLSAPTWADGVTSPDTTDQNDVTWLEAKYSPTQISGGGLSSSLSEVKLRAETGFWDDKMRAGVYFQFTPGNGTGNNNGVPVNNLHYDDFEIYAKLPFSLFDQDVHNNPYGANFNIAFKSTNLNGNSNALINGIVVPNTAFTFVNGTGFGFGLGYDQRWSRVTFSGLLQYYPSQNQNNLVTPIGTLSTYRDFVYRVNARTTLGPQNSDPGSGLGVSLGYDGESLQFSNATLTLSGVTFGVDYHF